MLGCLAEGMPSTVLTFVQIDSTDNNRNILTMIRETPLSLKEKNADLEFFAPRLQDGYTYNYTIIFSSFAEY